MYIVQLGDKKYYIDVNDRIASIQKIEEVFDDLPDFDEEEMGADACAILAPLPGNICSISVRPGDHVEKDGILFLCETMKMEMEIRSPIFGVVSRLEVAPGQHVEKGQFLAQIEPESSCFKAGPTF